MKNDGFQEMHLGDHMRLNKALGSTLIERDMPSEMKRRATVRRELIGIELEEVDHESA